MLGSPICMFYYRFSLDGRTGRPRARSERELLRATTDSQPRKEPIGARTYSRFCLMAMVFSSIAAADSVSFTGTIGGQPKSVGVPLLSRGTISYVSLTDLVVGFGGKTTLQPDQIQIDLSDGQAWLKQGETSVNSTLDSFDLRQPVLREGDTILVAVTDVHPFLMKAFGASTTQQVNRDSGVNPGDFAELFEDSMARRNRPTQPVDRGSRQHRSEIHVAIVDPGHGGSDTGLKLPGAAAEMIEKDITLAIALRVRGVLEQQLGIQVRMSRDEDLLLSNKRRVTLANGDQGDVLVSLHAGDSRAERAEGFEIFYSPGTPGLSAERIAQSLNDALVEATGTASRGVREARLSLFQDIEMPAVLIEVGFLKNAADAVRLVDESYQQKIAEGIAAGLAPFAKPRTNAGAP